jgi:hypothetical protein
MAKRAKESAVSRRATLDLEDDNMESVDDRYLVVVAPPPAAEDSGDAYLLAGLLVGAALGAVVGLFMAPRSGEETRRQITDRLPGNAGETLQATRRQVLRRLPGGAGETPATAEGTGPASPPALIKTPAALDPLAQVTHYAAPPVRTDAPAPYHAETEPAPPQTP